jgi:hypothetical membrane protein
MDFIFDMKSKNSKMATGTSQISGGQSAINQLLRKMKKIKGIMVLEAACILMLLAMFILPLFSVPEYSLIRNTLSELAAQSAPYAWVMNIIFVSLALGSVIAGWEFFEGFVLHRFILVLFGISLTLMAFFNHAPVNPDIQYNIREAGWHAYFACTTGLSFIILSIATSFILEKQHERQLAISTGISVIFLSVLISEADQAAGVWQRIMYLIYFGWMICSFKTRKF